MQVRDVKRLIDAMVDSDLTELEFEQRAGDGPSVFRVMLRRAAQGASGPDAGRTAAVADAAGAAGGGGSNQPSLASLSVVEAAAPSRLVDVAAPIVGTFYASPSPDLPPYVKVGDRVQHGAVLCIIEAMKLMNEIEAEVAGTVAEVLVANEDPVEYGQVLFRIDPG